MISSVLADHFTGAASKTLSAVEADAARSNQHEYNGTAALKALFGESEQKRIPARFFRFREEDETPLTSDGFLSWYDARENHPTRSEYRLYFSGNDVTRLAKEGDVIVFARRPDGTTFVILTDPSGTVWNQLAWLFGLGRDAGPAFEFADTTNATESGFAGRFILSELGIEEEPPGDQWLDQILARFGNRFPPTADFSAFARETLPGLASPDDPDQVLLLRMEREEVLFRELERHIIADRLAAGFTKDGAIDTDQFIAFSLSVQNRRKSRAGYAFAHHVEAALTEGSIRYKREATTEKRNAADFLFPGESAYHDPDFPDTQLKMLAVKTTCKDRWRQVLSEADRIQTKHLLTLEPAISLAQTDEMQSHSLQLVLPAPLHATFRQQQRGWLMRFSTFLESVRRSDT